MRRKLSRAIAAAVLVAVFAIPPWFANPAWAETVFTPSSDGDNGIVVQIPNESYGDNQPYGSGQLLVCNDHEGEISDPGPDGSLLCRFDEYGSFGTNGGVHVATGLRKTVVGAQQAVWIQPYQDVHGLIVSRPATKDYFQHVDPTGEVVLKGANNGSLVGRREIVARDGQSTRVAIGNTFGLPGACFGTACDASIYRKAAGVLGLGSALYFPKVAIAPGALANGAVPFAIDSNADGKLEFKVQFPTGAAVVVATEP